MGFEGKFLSSAITSVFEQKEETPKTMLEYGRFLFIYLYNYLNTFAKKGSTCNRVLPLYLFFLLMSFCAKKTFAVMP